VPTVDGVLADALLLDADSRGEALYVVNVRLLHELEELAGIGGEGFHVPPLPLRIDGVEGEDDLPDPLGRDDVILFLGSSTSMFLRLCSLAPLQRGVHGRFSDSQVRLVKVLILPDTAVHFNLPLGLSLVPVSLVPRILE